MALFKKKINTDNLEELRDISDDVIESDFVPYACHWDENTVITRNGEILQIVKITDDSASGFGAEEADLRQSIREALVGAVDGTEYAVWIHTVRRKTSFQSGGEFKRDFAGYLDRFWRDRNDWEHKFINEVYITVVREGEAAPLFKLKNVMRQVFPWIDRSRREQRLDQSCEQLTTVTEKIVEALSHFGARRLGVYKKNEIWYSEPCSFLGKLVTLQDDELPVAQVSIADYLTDYDVTFGYNAMEVRMRADGRRRFGSYVTIKEYRELPIESLETVLQMPTEFIISQCFLFKDANEALKGFEYQQQLFTMSGASALANRSGLRAVLDANTGRPTDYCSYQLGIFILAESVKALDSNVHKAVATLAALGMVGLREDIFLEECYWSVLPASFLDIKRFKPLNTSAMAGMVNLNNLPSGQIKGNHWGAAVTTFYTINHTPYFFNFHTGQNGHTVLVGPPDSGKKVLLNFLIAQSRKYDGKLFYFDRERLAEPFLRSVDGAYYNPCPRADVRPYVKLALNPLHMEDTGDNRQFIAEWLGILLKKTDVSALCSEVVAEVMQKPKEQRSLALCAELMTKKQPEAAAHFSMWLPGGEYGEVFAQEDSLSLEGKVHGFEMEDLVKSKVLLEPVFSYLMYRILQSLDGKPTIIVLDEAWDVLELSTIAPQLKDWFAKLQRKNAMFLLASEQVDDIKNSPLNPIIFSSVATKLFLPDDAADASYMDIFGIRPRDAAFLSAMNTEDRHFLVIKENESVVLEMDLSGMVDIVSVLSATPYHLQMMEQAIQARGISPSQWMPKFLETI